MQKSITLSAVVGDGWVFLTHTAQPLIVEPLLLRSIILQERSLILFLLPLLVFSFLGEWSIFPEQRHQKLKIMNN